MKSLISADYNDFPSFFFFKQLTNGILLNPTLELTKQKQTMKNKHMAPSTITYVSWNCKIPKKIKNKIIMRSTRHLVQ